MNTILIPFAVDKMRSQIEAARLGGDRSADHRPRPRERRRGD
jgi:hypothetical protein